MAHPGKLTNDCLEKFHVQIGNTSTSSFMMDFPLSCSFSEGGMKYIAAILHNLSKSLEVLHDLVHLFIGDRKNCLKKYISYISYIYI